VEPSSLIGDEKLAPAYQLAPDHNRWGRKNWIDALHAAVMPGIRCPSCGAWALTGISYPTVDVSLLKTIGLPASPNPIPIVEFQTLLRKAQDILGDDRLVAPGTQFGPLHGRAGGTFGDVAWLNGWTPLVRESVWHEIRRTGIRIAGVRAELDFDTKIRSR
jgi:hypothetical protein